MANPYFSAAPLTVYDGDVAKASDLNNMGVSLETAFDVTDQILQNIVLETNAALALADADVVLTHADVVLTHADVVLTHADVLLTHADVLLTNADVVSTGLDAVETAADVLLTNADVVLTHADVVSTAALYDSFDDRYLGSKATNPTLDNDGNALLTGALYWNTAIPEMRVYSGTVWVTAYIPSTTYNTDVQIHGATAKSIPADGDEFPLADSAASFGLKKILWSAIKTALNLLYVTKTSATGSATLPSGTTAQRDASPVFGATRANSTLTQTEWWNGTAWVPMGGGATGAPGNNVFFENDQTVTANYTITTGKNAVTAGPVSIADGVTVAIPTGSTWSIT